MGKVLVDERYLELLKMGLNIEHLDAYSMKHKNVATELEPAQLLDFEETIQPLPTSNEERHRAITEELTQLYLKKNADYGDSFNKSLDEDGLIVLKIRLGDKFNRFASLIKKDKAEVSDESLRDTLIDAANYAILGAMWLDNKEIEYTPKELVIAEEYASKDVTDSMDAFAHAMRIMTSGELALVGADLDGDYISVTVPEFWSPIGKAVTKGLAEGLNKGTLVREHNENPYIGYNIADIEKQAREMKGGTK